MAMNRPVFLIRQDEATSFRLLDIYIESGGYMPIGNQEAGDMRAKHFWDGG
jgi:hypothetical protein